MVPLKQWPIGHLIMALSSGPLVERMVNRHLTSAGSPHRTVSSRSRRAGQFRNIIMASVNHKVGYIDGCCGRSQLVDAEERMIVTSERREAGQSRR